MNRKNNLIPQSLEYGLCLGLKLWFEDAICCLSQLIMTGPGNSSTISFLDFADLQNYDNLEILQKATRISPFQMTRSSDEF